MAIKIELYKYLRKNVDKIASIIYIKVLKETVNIGSVAVLFSIGIKKIIILIKWLYFGFFVTILTYIVSIGNYLLNIFEIIFSYIQKLGKIIIDLIVSITGPLTMEVMNNIWLLILLIGIAIILIISTKVIKYYMKKRREVNEERKLFIDDLIKKLNEQDEIIKNQLNEIENNKKKGTFALIKNKEDMHEIQFKGVIYKIDLNKIKK